MQLVCFLQSMACWLSHCTCKLFLRMNYIVYFALDRDYACHVICIYIYIYIYMHSGYYVVRLMNENYLLIHTKWDFKFCFVLNSCDITNNEDFACILQRIAWLIYQKWNVCVRVGDKAERKMKIFKTFILEFYGTLDKVSLVFWLSLRGLKCHKVSSDILITLWYSS